MHSEECQRVPVPRDALKRGRRLHPDGYTWVKYGEKRLHPSGMVREYYKCGNWKPVHGGCKARKVVDRPFEEPSASGNTPLLHLHSHDAMPRSFSPSKTPPLSPSGSPTQAHSEPQAKRPCLDLVDPCPPGLAGQERTRWMVQEGRPSSLPPVLAVGTLQLPGPYGTQAPVSLAGARRPEGLPSLAVPSAQEAGMTSAGMKDLVQALVELLSAGGAGASGAGSRSDAPPGGDPLSRSASSLTLMPELPCNSAQQQENFTGLLTGFCGPGPVGNQQQPQRQQQQHHQQQHQQQQQLQLKPVGVDGGGEFTEVPALTYDTLLRESSHAKAEKRSGGPLPSPKEHINLATDTLNACIVQSLAPPQVSGPRKKNFCAEPPHLGLAGLDGPVAVAGPVRVPESRHSGGDAEQERPPREARPRTKELKLIGSIGCLSEPTWMAQEAAVESLLPERAPRGLGGVAGGIAPSDLESNAPTPCANPPGPSVFSASPRLKLGISGPLHWPVAPEVAREGPPASLAGGEGLGLKCNPQLQTGAFSGQVQVLNSADQPMSSSRAQEDIDVELIKSMLKAHGPAEATVVAVSGPDSMIADVDENILKANGLLQSHPQNHFALQQQQQQQRGSKRSPTAQSQCQAVPSEEAMRNEDRGAGQTRQEEDSWAELLSAIMTESKVQAAKLPQPLQAAGQGESCATGRARLNVDAARTPLAQSVNLNREVSTLSDIGNHCKGAAGTEQDNQESELLKVVARSLLPTSCEGECGHKGKTAIRSSSLPSWKMMLLQALLEPEGDLPISNGCSCSKGSCHAGHLNEKASMLLTLLLSLIDR